MKLVTGMMLAAGGSTRMGSPKQFLDYAGIPLVRHTAQVLLSSACHSVIVVVGRQAIQVREALADLPLLIIENPNWAEGMGSSLQIGLKEVPPQSDGVLITLADQPFITPTILNHFLDLQNTTGRSIVAARYADTVGVPAFFGRSLFPALLALPPDQGCKKIIQSQREAALLINCPEAEMDIDTPEDYARLLHTV